MVVSSAAKDEDGCMSHVPEDQDTDDGVHVSMNYATLVSILQNYMLHCDTV